MKRFHPHHPTGFGTQIPQRSPHGHGTRGFDLGPTGGFGGFSGPDGPGPGFGPRGDRRASRGNVREAILSLLGEAPSNGYGLIRAIVEKTGGAWSPSPGSIYPTLAQLVDEELLVAVGDGRRVEYDLTDSGRAYVTENAETLDAAWNATPGQSDSDAAFYQSFGKLMGVIKQFRSGSSEGQRLAAAEKLNETRRALYLILAE